MDCLPHIPHKEWASPQERENYLAIERWARLLLDHPTPGVDAVHLHLPHIEWSGDSYERENNLAIERWARHFQIYCLAAGAVPPTMEPILWSTGVTGFTYYHWLFSPPDYADEQIHYEAVNPIRWYLGPGVTQGAVSTADPRPSDINIFHVPPLSVGTIEIWFDFNEIPSADPDGILAAEPVDRLLHLVVTRDSDSAVLADVTETYSGTRGMTLGHLTYGPQAWPDAFTIYSYANWQTLAHRGTTDFAINLHVGHSIEVNGAFA